MGVLYDARGNELVCNFPDQVTGGLLPDTRPSSANLNAVNAEAVMDLSGQSTITIDLRGVWVGTVQFEATVDGTNYFNITCIFKVKIHFILSEPKHRAQKKDKLCFARRLCSSSLISEALA